MRLALLAGDQLDLGALRRRRQVPAGATAAAGRPRSAGFATSWRQPSRRPPPRSRSCCARSDRPARSHAARRRLRGRKLRRRPRSARGPRRGSDGTGAEPTARPGRPGACARPRARPERPCVVVLVVLTQLEQAADAEHSYRREQRKRDCKANSQAVASEGFTRSPPALLH